jgi:putative Ca2+/H+ antiporter (TMEM165/GDT1 family)
MGDKTQLLAFVLAARFKRPLLIVAGIFVATAVNHGLAGALGSWITGALGPEALRWLLGVSFLAMAVWTLIPDEIEKDEAKTAQRFGVFGATLVTFFLAEMGDKTQLATVALAAHYAMPLVVVVGTTLGMLLADAPAVYVGDKLSSRIPMRLVHVVAASLFALLGLATLLGAGAKLEKQLHASSLVDVASPRRDFPNGINALLQRRRSAVPLRRRFCVFAGW